MPTDKEPIEVTEITVGYGQNYRTNPSDPYVMARADIQLKAIVFPGILTEKDIRNRLMTRCQDAVMEFVETDQARIAEAEKFQ
jgi:hypothetical protein